MVAHVGAEAARPAGFTTRVISTVDIALWDLRGKLFGVPVATLLGAAHESLPAYVAGGYYTADGD